MDHEVDGAARNTRPRAASKKMRESGYPRSCVPPSLSAVSRRSTACLLTRALAHCARSIAVNAAVYIVVANTALVILFWPPYSRRLSIRVPNSSQHPIHRGELPLHLLVILLRRKRQRWRKGLVDRRRVIWGKQPPRSSAPACPPYLRWGRWASMVVGWAGAHYSLPAALRCAPCTPTGSVDRCMLGVERIVVGSTALLNHAPQLR